MRDADGKAVQGAVVRFQAQPPSDTLRRNEPALYVCSLSAPSCGVYGSQFFTDTIDSEGRAKTIIRFGQVAGRAVVKLGVPELGLVTDRYNNPRPELPTMSLGAGSAITLDAGKSTVTAKEMGTQWVFARYGDMAD